jgi:hypothetical protein
LNISLNSDLPATTTPNAAIYPYWDDLNPAAGGSVWFGTYGQAPNRKAVVSWIAVPHALTSPPPQTPLTFQSILHESGQITLQYQQVETGRSTLISGKSATIAVEDATGLFATKYTFNGSPAIVTNQQAMLFLPSNAAHPAPSLAALPPMTPGQFQLRVISEPGPTCVILASTNLTSWFPILRATIPASGVRVFTDSNAGAVPNRFYQATLGE